MRRLLIQASHFLRSAALLVVVFACLANPVLAAAEDTHEAVRGAVERLHAPAEHAPDVSIPDGESDLWHALIHAAHCCGHLTAILSDTLFVLPPVALAGIPAGDTLPGGSISPASDLRPPILAAALLSE